MAIIWKYKTELKDPAVFTEIEQQRGIVFPDKLKEFIEEANAATPSSYKFMVGNNERVLGAILSFNHCESGTDSVFTALAAIEDQSLLPFGIDPFGNYICYSLEDETIVFWDHETGIAATTDRSLKEYLDSLY